MYVTRKKRLPTYSSSAASFGPGSSTLHIRRHEGFDRPAAASAYQMSRNNNMGSNATDLRKMENARSRALSLNRGLGGPGFSHGRHRTGSYATLASFTSVPVGGAPIMSSRRSTPSQPTSQQPQQQQQATRIGGNVVSQRWLDHYSSNPTSIWSSTTMNTNLTASMGRPFIPPMSAKASSQGTLFEAATTPTVTTKLPPQNSLVLENGMLKLCPPKPPVDEEVVARREVEQAQKDFAVANAAAANRAHSPFYQNVTRQNRPGVTLSEGGTLSSHEEEQLYSDLGSGGPVGPYSLFTPQMYPHLMPQNIMQAQKRMPRSSSGGSVLV
jgi:hypothetical protein